MSLTQWPDIVLYLELKEAEETVIKENGYR